MLESKRCNVLSTPRKTTGSIAQVERAGSTLVTNLYLRLTEIPSDNQIRITLRLRSPWYQDLNPV